MQLAASNCVGCHVPESGIPQSRDIGHPLEPQPSSEMSLSGKVCPSVTGVGSCQKFTVPVTQDADKAKYFCLGHLLTFT
jgi:hypothetical protein